MSKSRNDIKLILFQFRLAKEMREQEFRCYVKFTKLKPKQIIVHNILKHDFDIQLLDDIDAVIIGGTGDFGAYHIRDKYPGVYKQLEHIAHYCRKKKIPVLGVCMQVWAIIFGGEVRTNASLQEVGTFTIKLTKYSKKDPLFYNIPSEFKAQLGHKDYVSKLPKNAVLLAYSDLCPTHAFRMGDREYFLQFHPDLDKKSLIERINLYRSYVPGGPDTYNKFINSVEETPICNTILENFINRIVLR